MLNVRRTLLKFNRLTWNRNHFGNIFIKHFVSSKNTAYLCVH